MRSCIHSALQLLFAHIEKPVSTGFAGSFPFLTNLALILNHAAIDIDIDRDPFRPNFSLVLRACSPRGEEKKGSILAASERRSLLKELLHLYTEAVGTG